MPSSSTRKTSLEISLLAHYRTVSVHLSLARWEDELHFLTRQFATLLDYSLHEMAVIAKPDLADFDGDFVAWKNESLPIFELEKTAMRLSSGDCVWVAADAVADVGWALIKVGREREGEDYLEWGMELQDREAARRSQ